MNKKETAELRRRFKKESASFSCISGCYVDAEKQKICTFNTPFLTLKDEELFKYLDIAKKTLSGTLKNQLLSLDFPLNEEEPGGKQDELMQLLNSGLKDEALLDVFYDRVIEVYQHTGNYLILLFADAYDVPFKTSDEFETGESVDVYRYIICAVCPVELSKPGLGYLQDEQRIGLRDRDWVVNDPETAFLFPAFNDRAADIHQVLFYTRDTKNPHGEVMTELLGCREEKTASELKVTFEKVVTQVLGPDNEGTDLSLMAFETSLNELRLEHEEAWGDAEEAPEFLLEKETIREALSEVPLPDDKKVTMEYRIEKAFEDKAPEVKAVLDLRAIRQAEPVLQKNELLKELSLTPFFKSVLDQDEAPIVLCDLEHTILYMNPAALKRYEGQTAVGQNLMACHNPETREMIRRVIAWFAEDESHNKVLETHNEKENKDVYTVALRNENGRLIGYYEKHEYRNKETAERYDFR